MADSPEGDRQPINYGEMSLQNRGRRLTAGEFDEVRSRIAAIHFVKEAFADDRVVMSLLYAAEALQREVEFLLPDNPFEE